MINKYIYVENFMLLFEVNDAVNTNSEGLSLSRPVLHKVESNMLLSHCGDRLILDLNNILRLLMIQM